MSPSLMYKWYGLAFSFSSVFSFPNPYTTCHCVCRDAMTKRPIMYRPCTYFWAFSSLRRYVFVNYMSLNDVSRPRQYTATLCTGYYAPSCLAGLRLKTSGKFIRGHIVHGTYTVRVKEKRTGTLRHISLPLCNSYFSPLLTFPPPFSPIEKHEYFSNYADC